MADKNDKVMRMVERTLKRKPGASTDELYEKAKGIDKSIGELTLRQFNARYPLQVKRKMNNGGKRRRRRKGGRKKGGRTGRRRARAGDSRAAVREVLIQFAKRVAAADDPEALLDVVAGIDGYVDDVMKAASK
jgi:hypothetical protein